MTQVFDSPIYSSDQSIDRVLQAGLPVVLVFLEASGASPLDGAIKSLARQEAGRLLVVVMNIKESQQTARRFQIQSAPAVVTVKDGTLQSKAEGIHGADLDKHARYLLGKGPKPAVQERSRAASAGGVSGSSGVSQPGSTQTAGAGQPVNVTDASFDQEVMRSTLPVIVDFWAPWCGPCRMVAPMLERTASELRGQVKVVKVNVDENPQTAGRFGVQAIPTMIIVKDGRVVDQWAGALPEQAMRARLARAVQ